MSDKDKKRQMTINTFFSPKKQKTDDGVVQTEKAIAASTSMLINPLTAPASTSYIMQERDIGKYLLHRSLCVFHYFIN